MAALRRGEVYDPIKQKQVSEGEVAALRRGEVYDPIKQKQVSQDIIVQCREL